MKLPTPQELQPLVDAAKNAVGQDVHICVGFEYRDERSSIFNLPWSVRVDFTAYRTHKGEVAPTGNGVGATPEIALATFVASFKPAPTPADEIAQLEARIAKLKGQSS
jgi:hypothetical protein